MILKKELIMELILWRHAEAEPGEPGLGRLAALLVTGTEQDWPIRKGCVWWIEQRIRADLAQTYVRAVMGPELVLK